MSDHHPLSANVQNSMLEIHCLVDLKSLFHVRPAANLANLGTKEGAPPGTLILRMGVDE